MTETMAAFMELQRAGKIRFYGVSNWDLGEMKDLWRVPGGQAVQTNQILYNLSRRGIEWDLLPWLRRQRIPAMAYSPMDKDRIAFHVQRRTLGRSATESLDFSFDECHQ